MQPHSITFSSLRKSRQLAFILREWKDVLGHKGMETEVMEMEIVVKRLRDQFDKLLNRFFARKHSRVIEKMSKEVGNRTFTCNICGKTFNKPCGLGGHLSKVHPGRFNKPKAPEEVQIDMMIAET